jgi:hypothetical protein
MKQSVSSNDDKSEKYLMRQEKVIIQEDKPAQPSNLENLRSFVALLTYWIENSLPVIERGINIASADPIELVMAFSPWLQECLERIGPNRTALNSAESYKLKDTLGRVYDAIERVYYRSGQSPTIGLSMLPGFDDLLIVLALRSRGAIWVPSRSGEC